MSLGNSGRLRCLFVWSVASVGLGLTAQVAGGPARAMVSGLAGGGLVRTPLDVALTHVAAALLLGCATWCWMVITVVVVEATRGVAGEVRSWHGVPAGVRRVVLAACGVTLAGALAPPTYALSAQTHFGDRPCHLRAHHGLAGLPLPDRAVAPRHAGRTGHRRATHETVVVRPGDTLWAIAVRGLPPGSPDARIAVRWHAIYAANRSVIGPDPDLIGPGQRLLLPGKDPS